MPASASPPPSPPVRTPGQQPSHPASATNRSRTPPNDRFALYSPRNPDRRWIRAKGEAALLALPGVGQFTAAIVRSLGHGEDAAALDTNVVRLLGRLVHGDLQPTRETPPKELAETARWLMPPGSAARWNPALMDYGAQVCASRPRCEACVVAELCAARPRFERGEQAEPVRAQARFEGSDRQWRGRILAALREAEGPLRTALLARDLAGGAEQRATVRRLLADLCAEGLAWQRDGSCGLRGCLRLSRWGSLLGLLAGGGLGGSGGAVAAAPRLCFVPPARPLVGVSPPRPLLGADAWPGER